MKNSRGIVLRSCRWSGMILAIVALAAMGGWATFTLAEDSSATLNAAAKAMGTSDLKSIEFKGSGSAYNFGQAVNASLPWPRFVLKTYVADIDYATPAMRQEMYRTQLDGTPPFGGFTQIQEVSGNTAWNMAGNPAAPVPAPANVGEWQLRIWLTPAGFIKAAMANHAMVKGKTITFTTPDHHKVVGTLDAQNMLVKSETWIDNPVLGDMPIVTTYSNYKDFGGVKFPMTIAQSEGGHPFLDLNVSDVKPNGAAAIDVPASVQNAEIPAPHVVSEKIGDGVWFLTGGTHNSLVAEFNDHIVVIESPLDEARAGAVMAEAHRLVPNKPITYVVNSHNHFDHLGGIRRAAAEGATIITAESNKAYYEKVVFANPHTLNPDKLAESKKKVKVEGVEGKRVLTDGTHEIDLYVQPLTGHNDSMMLIYFPKDKILSEADAYTPPPAPATSAPAQVNPFNVQIYDEIQQLKLNVDKIAPLHGRMSTLAELKLMIGKANG